MGFCFKSLSCSYQVLTTDNLALILALEQERKNRRKHSNLIMRILLSLLRSSRTKKGKKKNKKGKWDRGGRSVRVDL